MIVCAAALADTGTSLIVTMIISSRSLCTGRRARRPEREVTRGRLLFELRADGLGVLAKRGHRAHDRRDAGHLDRRQERADLAAGRADGAPAVPGEELRVFREVRRGAQPRIRD